MLTARIELLRKHQGKAEKKNGARLGRDAATRRRMCHVPYVGRVRWRLQFQNSSFSPTLSLTLRTRRIALPSTTPTKRRIQKRVCLRLDVLMMS